MLDRGCLPVRVRGGGELGQQWYEDGKVPPKSGILNDYRGADAFIIKTGLRFARRCVMGWAGARSGILMGVISTKRPSFFHGVIAEFTLC